MKTLQLQYKDHGLKIGQTCPDVAPNVSESCYLKDPEGNVVGLFLNTLEGYDDLRNAARIANLEFNSDRVPKSVMSRGIKGQKDHEVVEQLSTILGSVPPKPHMKRHYPNYSSVHRHKSSKDFTKAMLVVAKESRKILAELLPDQLEAQKEAIKNTPEKWRFGKLWTSSINNYNIAAALHRDNANLPNTVNVIITKRENSKGGNLYVPEYDACFDQGDESLLMYPAWKNMHGVTPIHPTKPGGYRNSFILYPLKAFEATTE